MKHLTRRTLSSVRSKTVAHHGGLGDFFAQREPGMGREKIERPQAHEHTSTHPRG